MSRVIVAGLLVVASVTLAQAGGHYERGTSRYVRHHCQLGTPCVPGEGKGMGHGGSGQGGGMRQQPQQ